MNLQPCVVVSSLVHVSGVFMHDMFGCMHAFCLCCGNDDMIEWWVKKSGVCHGAMSCIVLN